MIAYHIGEGLWIQTDLRLDLRPHLFSARLGHWDSILPVLCFISSPVFNCPSITVVHQMHDIHDTSGYVSNLNTADSSKLRPLQRLLTIEKDVPMVQLGRWTCNHP